jgi:hypothetical protein
MVEWSKKIRLMGSYPEIHVQRKAALGIALWKSVGLCICKSLCRLIHSTFVHVGSVCMSFIIAGNNDYF